MLPVYEAMQPAPLETGTQAPAQAASNGDFVPRVYQLELLEMAQEHNVRRHAY